MDQHANKKHRQSRPSVVLHSLEQSRRNIGRAAGRQALCNTINNGRTLTQAPSPRPVCQGRTHASSDSKTQVEVKLNEVRSTSSHNKTAGSSPSTRHGLRPQTTDKKNPLWESPGAWPITTSIRHTHTTQHTHTNYIGGVSDLSLAQTQTPLPPDSNRLDPSRLDFSLLGEDTEPACLALVHYLPLELPSVTTGRHRLLHPPRRRRLCPGRQHYPSPVTHLPSKVITYLPFKTLSHTPRSIPASSHHTAAHCTARHRGAHHTQRIAWCHRLPHHRAPGLHDSSPAVNTPAAACRPTQLRPHPAAVSTCCAGPRRKCSTIGQSSPCLLTRSPARDSPRVNLTLDRCRPGFQVCQSASLQSVPRWSCPPSGGVHPAVMAGLPPAWQKLLLLLLPTLHCTIFCVHTPCPLRPVASF